MGCGDIGERIAGRLQRQGVEPTGVVRSAQSAARLRQSGIAAVVTDLDDEPPPVAGTVIWLAPPPRDGDRDTRLRRFCAAARPVSQLLYLSTSAVYGDCGGAWIDEEAPLQPGNARGRRRVDAERALLEWARQHTADLRILRVPGIYGPGRLPRRRLQEGLPLIRREECPYTNRIHADDLAAAAIAVLERGAPGRAYNIADGHPTTMTDYFLRCAALLGLPQPPQVPLADARRQMSDAMWSFMEESKRLRVDRLRDEIGFKWQYPDLDSGLPATLAAEHTHGNTQ